MARKGVTFIGLLLFVALTLSACRAAPEPTPPPEAISLGVGEPKAVTPDGQTLLVVRTTEDRNEAWLVANDGSTSHKVFDFTSPTFYAAFSPAGEHLVLVADKMWLAKADGSEQRVLLEREEGLGPIAWSPTGQEIAFVAEEEIGVVNLAGEVRRVAAAPESVLDLEWVRLPSGEERLFLNSLPAEEPPFVASISIANGQLQRLAAAEFFSVAGDQLYLSDPLGEGRLWVVNATDGSNARTIVDSQVRDFVVRPEHQEEVAILQQTGELQYDLLLVPSPGATPTPLTSGSLAISPLWAPDGKILYFSAFDLEAPDEVDDPFTVMKLDLSQ
ncbi:MAG: hypothetical protein GX033_08470 [Firmicutes bacterium]|nr:hypothetical protein [Bacillota bacterium]